MHKNSAPVRVSDFLQMLGKFCICKYRAVVFKCSKSSKEIKVPGLTEPQESLDMQQKVTQLKAQ